MNGRSARAEDGDVVSARVFPERPGMLPASLLADSDVTVGRTQRTTRDWIVDAICFFVAIGLGALLYFILDAQGRLPPAPGRIADLVLAGLACVSMWWRRRWPVTIAVCLGLLGCVFAVGAGAAVIALFTVAVHRRFPIAAAVALLHVASTLPYLLMYPDPNSPYWASVGYAAASIVAVVLWGMTVRARRQLVLSLRDRADRAEAEQQLRAEQARRAERTRIAREMHDVLAHRISLLSTYAGALEFRRDASPDEVARAASVMRASAHQALQDLREVIGVLREDANGAVPERPQPTLADLPELIEESRRAGMRVSWESYLGDTADVPAIVGRAAYRIVQEALTNARKHARGTTVRVEVTGAVNEGLALVVRNPLPVGQEVSPAIPGGGSGLVGLAERASLAGGRLEHGRDDDGDFRLSAWLPWST